ncbi:ABC transporter ATP-binding protein [Streptomyces klenkii]|uniref:ABC transporter ATP-binding protein n=1 Tax=Streptomyces klenkii TaxID=1420899 RepID=UPI0036EEDEC1
MDVRRGREQTRDGGGPRPVGMAKVVRFAASMAWRADRARVMLILGVQSAGAGGLGTSLLVARGGLTHLPGSATGGELRHLVPVLAVLALVAVITAAARTLSQAQQTVLAVKVSRDALASVLAAAVAVSLAKFENPHFHDRVERAVAACQSQLVVLIMLGVALLQALLGMAAVAVVLATTAWWLVPLVAVSALPAVLAGKARSRDLYTLHKKLAQNRRSRSYLQELLTGRDTAKEVRAFGLGPVLTARWHTRYAEEVDATRALAATHGRRLIAARLAADTGLVLLAALLLLLVHTRTLTPASAATAAGGLWLLSQQVHALGTLFSTASQNLLHLTDLREFTRTPSPPPPPPPRPLMPRPLTPSPHAAGDLTHLNAVDVTFTYPGAERPALRQVSITLAPGRIVALVGENGSGKSTLAKLLAGLYTPDAGHISRDGAPVTDPALLCAGCAVLFQDFARYKLSANDNIAFGRPGTAPDPADVQHAARAAGIHDHLARLPAGYATQLGTEYTDGVDLSGGQWQRLALARAFYRDAPLVILDEPTASLDPRAEAALFDATRALFAGRTVLLISHRFSSVRSADRIYVLADGRITEEGTHDDLMCLNGGYASMFLAQAAAYLDPPGPATDVTPALHKAD